MKKNWYFKIKAIFFIKIIRLEFKKVRNYKEFLVKLEFLSTCLLPYTLFK